MTNVQRLSPDGRVKPQVIGGRKILYPNCKNNNIKLIEIPYTEIKNIGDILTKELKLG